MHTNITADSKFGITVSRWYRYCLIGVLFLAPLCWALNMFVIDGHTRLIHLTIKKLYLVDAAVEKGQPLAQADRRELIGLLAGQPYRPDLVFALYRDAEARNATSDIKLLSEQMARLGWRNSAAQRALMLKAAEDLDYVEVLKRADALMRRRVASDEIMQIIYLFERTPKFQRSLTETLMRDPPWRKEFLSTGPDLDIAAFRKARLLTVDSLYAANDSVERGELVALVDALVRAGEDQDAARLWKRFAGQDQPKALNDPNFIGLARAGTESMQLQMPFEWRIGEGQGYNVYAVRGGGLAIEWDGRLTPMFLSQKLWLRRGDKLAITMRLESSISGVSSALDLMLVCDRGRSETRLVPSSAMGSDRRVIVFTAPSGVPCDFPELRVVGALQDTRQSHDIRRASIS